jgi:hypothetical protein
MAPIWTPPNLEFGFRGETSALAKPAGIIEKAAAAVAVVPINFRRDNPLFVFVFLLILVVLLI